MRVAAPAIQHSHGLPRLNGRPNRGAATVMRSGRGGGDVGVARWIEEHLGSGAVTAEKFLGGSSWSSCYLYETSGGARYFVKLALGRSAAEMFEGEALGLRAMRATATLRIPEVLHYGELPGPPSGGALRGGGSFIVMEHLNLRGAADQEALGRQLAAMHLAAPADPEAAAGRFGFAVDNTIGGTPQPNSWEGDWVTFFRERRLRHQLRLANDSTLSRLGDRLCAGMGAFFEGAGEIRPSVLHGDLWSGNIAGADGEPAIFDPATYYGHHEAEFGMSWCAGFGGAFWRAYHEVIPRAPGWDDRHDLYTLYHYLNHYNMFGGSYHGSCVQIMERLNKKL